MGLLQELIASADSDAGLDALIDALAKGIPDEPKAEVAPALVVNPQDLFGTLQAMKDFMKAIPPEQMKDASLYMQRSGSYLIRLAQLKGVSAQINEQSRELVDMFSFDPTAGDKSLAAFTAAGDEANAAVMADIVAANEVVAKAREDAKAFSAEFDRIQAERVLPLRVRIAEIVKTNAAAALAFEGGPEKIEELAAAGDTALRDALAEYAKTSAELRDGALAKIEETRQLIADAENAAGEKLVAAVLAQSSISEDAAMEWANAQTITKTAAARLKKGGYAIENVRKDMAEFYRLTHGRLSAVKLDSSGGKRASAGGIHGYGVGVINMGSVFNKRVLFHEMGHHLEADPLVLASSKAFLVSRRESETPRSMRSIAGNVFYRSDEVAYKDHFFDAYVGKIYPDATEVISMGIESFASPAMLTQRVAKDPQMFAYVVGMMKTPPHPLYAAVKQLRAACADAEVDLQQDLDKEWNHLLSLYIEDYPIKMGENFGVDVSMVYTGARGPVTVIGTCGDFIVASGNGIRNQVTKRRGKCLLLIKLPRNDDGSLKPMLNGSPGPGTSVRYIFQGDESYARGCAKYSTENAFGTLEYQNLGQMRRLMNGN